MNLYSMFSYLELFGLNEIGSVAYSFKIMDMDRDVLVIPPTLTFSIPGKEASYDASGTDLYQQEGIRIVAKGLAEDTFEYCDDLHLLLLIENNSSLQLQFDADYNSVSVNGYMTSFICYSQTVAPGGTTVLDVELMGYSLEKNGIAGLGDITEVELTIKIRNDNYKTISEPVVKFAVG